MNYFTIALKLGEEILKQIPDFDQRKRAEYHRLTVAYNNEITKNYPERDDDLIMNLRDDIKLMWEDIIKHMGGK